MPVVQFGNPSPVDSKGRAEGEVCDHCGMVNVQHAAVGGPLVFQWSVPDAPRGDQGHYSLTDCLSSVTKAWDAHTWDDAPAPLWVSSSSEALQSLLADHFGCPVGRPDDFQPASTSDFPAVAPDAVDPLAEPAPAPPDTAATPPAPQEGA